MKQELSETSFCLAVSIIALIGLEAGYQIMPGWLWVAFFKFWLFFCLFVFLEGVYRLNGSSLIGEVVRGEIKNPFARFLGKSYGQNRH